MKSQHFTHRPPSVGIHLLSDPFPKRTTFMNVEEQATSVSEKRRIPRPKMKKSGLRA